MTKTEHYGLPQWVESDRILMEDFNAMTAAIDALCGNCCIAAGSYVGTGTHGADKPNRVELGFRPLIFIPNCTDQGVNGEHLAWFYPRDNFDFRTNSSTDIHVTWEDTGLSWYGVHNGAEDESIYQFNKLDQTYHYIAIGVRA